MNTIYLTWRCYGGSNTDQSPLSADEALREKRAEMVDHYRDKWGARQIRCDVETRKGLFELMMRPL